MLGKIYYLDLKSQIYDLKSQKNLIIKWRLKLIEIKHINNYYYLDLNFNSTFETDMSGYVMSSKV